MDRKEGGRHIDSENFHFLIYCSNAYNNPGWPGAGARNWELNPGLIICESSLSPGFCTNDNLKPGARTSNCIKTHECEMWILVCSLTSEVRYSLLASVSTKSSNRKKYFLRVSIGYSEDNI